MSIEHKNTSEVANLESASPVGDAIADEVPHHPIAEFFPMLAEKELKELAEDIAAHGQRDPGVVWNGMLLHGRNRRLACKLKNIPFKAVTRDFADESKAESPESRQQISPERLFRPYLWLPAVGTLGNDNAAHSRGIVVCPAHRYGLQAFRG